MIGIRHLAVAISDWYDPVPMLPDLHKPGHPVQRTWRTSEIEPEKEIRVSFKMQNMRLNVM